MSARALGLAIVAVLAGCHGQDAGTDAANPQDAAPPLSATASPPVIAQPGIPAVACAAGETPVFTCKFADGKRVSVCGTAPGKAEYRFGGDQPEIVIAGGARANVMYSGGGEQQLAFANGDTRYIVFSRMVRTRFDGAGNEPAISDGVVVERAGAFAAIRICDDPELRPVDVDAAEKYLPAGDADGGDLFTEETIRADLQGHE